MSKIELDLHTKVLEKLSKLTNKEAMVGFDMNGHRYTATRNGERVKLIIKPKESY